MNQERWHRRDKAKRKEEGRGKLVKMAKDETVKNWFLAEEKIDFPEKSFFLAFFTGFERGKNQRRFFGAATFSIMTFRITTFGMKTSIMAFIIMMFYLMAISVATFRIMKQSI
jgi:hypothetical protein